MNGDDTRSLIIGVGTEYGDDAFGLRVARELKGRGLSGIKVTEHSGEGASLIESWQGYDKVVIIDCCSSGLQLGSHFRFDSHTERIPTGFFRYSTHAFGVAEAIETARALKRLPESLIVIGVEGKVFNAGTPLSPALESMVALVADQAIRELY